ncbi:hypothetical protein RDI58_014795 [Solanum bulbocastanum]|uniref:Uncharacterized protein n=1 Tax=Solanum bulbocastanum TaxID=147425 RepID=A0AAN8TFN9_SOLBU
MENHVVEDLFELTRYTKGKLPFRYFGVPITAKRLSAVDCEILVDKMVAKVKVWGLRDLSYVGRVHASRWRINTHSGETKNKKGKKIASKSLHYFPLKPRLQRLFMSTKTSTLMTWHKDERVDDGIMRHPADSMA